LFVLCWEKGRKEQREEEGDEKGRGRESMIRKYCVEGCDELLTLLTLIQP